MVYTRKVNRIYIASLIAFFVNILLFALIPNFIEPESEKNDLEVILPVNLLHIKNQTRTPEKEEDPQEPLKKPVPKTIPKVAITHKLSKIIASAIQTPSIDLEINPALSDGIKIGGLVKDPGSLQNFKDFYGMAEVDKKPITILKTKPVYPYRAKRLNINGEVDVKFLVNENGYVSNIQILKSTPPGMFDNSVLKALTTWKFSPGMIQGHAVSTWVVTTIEFKVEG